MNVSQLRQIKELSDLYSLALDRNTRKNPDELAPTPDKELQQAKLMRQICESNYHLVQQVTQVKKSSLKDRIRVLEEELSTLQA